MMQSCHHSGEMSPQCHHSAEMVILCAPVCTLWVVWPETIHCRASVLCTIINEEESTSSCCHIKTSIQGFLRALFFAGSQSYPGYTLWVSVTIISAACTSPCRAFTREHTSVKSQGCLPWESIDLTSRHASASAGKCFRKDFSAPCSPSSGSVSLDELQKGCPRAPLLREATSGRIIPGLGTPPCLEDSWQDLTKDAVLHSQKTSGIEVS